MRRQLFLALVLLSTLGLAAPAWAESTRLWSFTPPTGFVDDAMAFDAAGTQFAYVLTDAAHYLKVIVRRTEAGWPIVAELSITPPEVIPEELVFSLDGKRLVLVTRDGNKPTRSAMLLDLERRSVLKRLGSASYAKVIAHEGTQLLALTSARQDRRGGTSFQTVAYRASDFARTHAGQVHVAADFSLQQLNLRLLYWERDHMSLVGVQKGQYDRTRDIRLPDRAVRYNLLGGKIVWSEEPQDVVQWTRAITQRPNHLGQCQFVQASDDLRSLFHVADNNKITSLATPLPWGRYEPKSLRQVESWDAQTLYFSLAVDPVNPDAVKRKKADLERVDLYRLDPGPRSTLLGQVLTRGRGYTWAASQRYFAYLFKLKGFGRGGKEVAVFSTQP